MTNNYDKFHSLHLSDVLIIMQCVHHQGPQPHGGLSEIFAQFSMFSCWNSFTIVHCMKVDFYKFYTTTPTELSAAIISSNSFTGCPIQTISS